MAEVIKRTWKTGRGTRRASWGYTYQVDGQQIRKYDARWTEDDAREALVAAQRGDTGVAAPLPIVDPEPAPAAPAPGMTLGAMVEKFLTEKRAEGKCSIGDDEERSVPLLAFLGHDTPLSAITTRRVAEYRVARLATTSRRKTLLSPATVNRECALLRSILRMALAWDELTKLPVFKMAKEEGRERFLSAEEITRLLHACGQSQNTMLLPIVTVALHTGLRKGEVLGLRWEHVSFSRGVILLGRRSTKSKKGREVPVNQVVYQVLAPLREAAGKQDAAGRVWGSVRKIDTAYNTALVRAKILDEEVNFHTLRHTFASHYIMRGGSIVKLQAILGHASVRTTQIYARLAPDHLVGATGILEGLGVNLPAHASAHGHAGDVAIVR